MDRLLIHVEGQAEETFVNEVLGPHLYNFGFLKVSARLVGNARQRARRGGIRGWDSVRADIVNHLKEDARCLATTMVDYYGLPQTGTRAWPGRARAGGVPFLQKAPTVENALLSDVCDHMGSGFDPSRFFPYVVMHEFEGFLFSDCAAFGSAIGHPQLVPQLQAVRSSFVTPEEINDSPETHPSRRVESLVPDYEKPLFGVLGILAISLATIRDQCPHFRSWMEHLESWARS